LNHGFPQSSDPAAQQRAIRPAVTLAAGLTLIFGIMGVVNLAHGSFWHAGAYVAYALTSLTGSLTIATIENRATRVRYQVRAPFRFSTNVTHLDQVLLTFGLILPFEEMRSIL
jgi:branched-chain amino acid transport system permease protein